MTQNNNNYCEDGQLREHSIDKINRSDWFTFLYVKTDQNTILFFSPIRRKKEKLGRVRKCASVCDGPSEQQAGIVAGSEQYIAMYRYSMIVFLTILLIITTLCLND